MLEYVKHKIRSNNINKRKTVLYEKNKKDIKNNRLCY